MAVFSYQQLYVEFLGEEPLSSDLRQGLVQDHVPRSLDHLVNQTRNHVVGACDVSYKHDTRVKLLQQ